MWKKNNDGQSLPRVGKVASEASRIGFWRDEKERRRSSQVRRLREHPSAAPKGSQPRLAALGSPFQGKGLAWTLPPSYGRRCPEGAEVGWGKRCEKQVEKIVSSAPLYESTRASMTRSSFPDGKGKEEAASPPKKEANPASLRSAAPSKGRGSRGYSLLPMEGGAPKGRRLDGGRGMKKSGEIVSGRRFTKATSAKQLIKPIYSYKKRKSNAANDFNVICRSGYRQMHEKSEAVHFYD